jgi:hypothetical protein
METTASTTFPRHLYTKSTFLLPTYKIQPPLPPLCLTSPLPRSSKVLRHSWYLTTQTTPSQRPTLHPKPRSIIPNSSSPRSAPQPYPHPHSFPAAALHSTLHWRLFICLQYPPDQLASSGTDKHGEVEDQKTPDLTLPDSSGSGRLMLWNRTALALPCHCAVLIETISAAYCTQDHTGGNAGFLVRTRAWVCSLVYSCPF